LFSNCIYCHVFRSERVKQNYNSSENKTFYFWRTYDGQEIDLIEESSGKVNAFEFKWGEKMSKVPRAFTDNYPDSQFSAINKANYLDFVEL